MVSSQSEKRLETLAQVLFWRLLPLLGVYEDVEASRHEEHTFMEQVQNVAAIDAANEKRPSAGENAESSLPARVEHSGDTVLRAVATLQRSEMETAVSPQGKQPSTGASPDRSRGRKRSSIALENDESFQTAWPALKRVLLAALDRIQKRDVNRIFAEPVDPVAVPGYLDIIKEPMDLGTIRRRIEEGAYTSFAQVVRDTDLIWRNCFYFNPPASIFYRAGEACKQEARRAWKNARERLIRMMKDPTIRDATERFLYARPLKKRGKAGNTNEESLKPTIESSFSTQHDSERVAATTITTREATQEEPSTSFESGRQPTTLVRFRPSTVDTDTHLTTEDSSMPYGKKKSLTSASLPQQGHAGISSLTTGPIRISIPESVSTSKNPREDEPPGTSLRSDSSQAADITEPYFLITQKGCGGPRYTKNESRTGLNGQRQASWVEAARQQNMLWPPLLGRISSSFLLLQELMVREWRHHQEGRTGTLSKTSGHQPSRAGLSYRQLLSQVSRMLPSWTMRIRADASVTGVSTVPVATDWAAMDPHHGSTHGGAGGDTGESVSGADPTAELTGRPYCPNTCRPLRGRRFMALAAYTQSLRRFVRDAGDMAHRIVDELISPDGERERVVQQWRLEVAAWEKRLEQAQEARISEFDRACQSFRKRVLCLQHEGRDFDWLRDTVFDPELAEQVESLSLDTIDDSMPYGVSSTELRALRDYLWERTNTHGKRIPWLDAMIQVTEQKPPPGQALPPKELFPAAVDRSYQEKLSSSVTGTRTGQAPVPKPTTAHGTSSIQNHHPGTGPASMAPETTQTPHPVMNIDHQSGASYRSAGRGRLDAASANPLSSETPLSCANCGTTETPGWRQGENKDQRLCNACGLFWVKYKRQRPPNLWRQSSRSTKAAQTPPASVIAVSEPRRDDYG